MGDDELTINIDLTKLTPEVRKVVQTLHTKNLLNSLTNDMLNIWIKDKVLHKEKKLTLAEELFKDTGLSLEDMLYMILDINQKMKNINTLTVPQATPSTQIQEVAYEPVTSLPKVVNLDLTNSGVNLARLKKLKGVK